MTFDYCFLLAFLYFNLCRFVIMQFDNFCPTACRLGEEELIIISSVYLLIILGKLKLPFLYIKKANIIIRLL
jgi:hypothetical protein